MSKDSIFKGTPIAKGFAVDQAKVDNGVWRDHDDSGVTVKIRRSSRPEHKTALRKFFKPFQHLTSVPPRDELRVKMKAGAQELVADWGIRVKILDDDGNPTGETRVDPIVNEAGEIIRPTEENVLAAFIEQEDFFRWVVDEADTFEHYRIEAVEAAAGNSQPSSDGSGSGAIQQQLPSSTGEQSAASESPPSSQSQG